MSTSAQSNPSEKEGADRAVRKGGYAATWDELADRLGVSRKSLQNWRNREDLQGLFPRDRADGRKDVAAWSAFMVKHQLARADEQTDGQFPEGSVTDWKRRREQLMCVRLEREIAKGDEQLLVAADLEVVVGQLLAGVQTALSQLPGTASRFLVGLRDVHDVQERLEGEVDAVLQQLNVAKYLEDCVQEEVEACQKEERVIWWLVNQGIPEEEFRAFIADLAKKVLAGVGRRGLARLRQGPSEADLLDDPASEGSSTSVPNPPTARAGSGDHQDESPTPSPMSPAARRRRAVLGEAPQPGKSRRKRAPKARNGKAASANGAKSTKRRKA